MQVQKRTEKSRVLIGVQQLEFTIAQKVLISYEIQFDRQGPLGTLGYGCKRVVASKTDADVRIRFTVHYDRTGDQHIRMPKVGQLLFPIRIFKSQEKSSDGTGIVQRNIYWD